MLVAGGSSGGALASAEVYDPATGVWSGTGDLNAARMDHTATLLPDGRVLVAGGYGSAGFLAGAEVYDPTTGVWSATGSLNAARDRHTATLLPDGRVLVAGGWDGIGVDPLASAEVYDPAAGTWSATGSLNTAREKHTATLLPDGRVLVAGGWIGFVSLASAEVYDPTGDGGAGTWSATGSLNAARSSHTATLLPDGHVLVAGGWWSDGWLASSEVYDPAAGTWSATGSLNTARTNHTATLLPDGRVLVAGGYDISGAPLASAEVYDPAAGAWSTTGSLNAARGHHTATLLPDGRVLVAGGYSSGGGHLASAEVYDPAGDGGAGAWSSTGSLNAARYRHTATLLPDGRVLVAGGRGGAAPTASAEVHDPATGVWSTTGSLNAARTNHTATLLPDGRVLVAGGWGSGGCLASAEVYDPAAGIWSSTGNLNAARRHHTATLLPDSRVLVAGGDDSGVPLASAEVYDPATGVWSTTGSLNDARYNHTATLLPDGRVLVAGGLDSDFNPLASAEVYDRGLGFQVGWRPTLSSATSPLVLTTWLAAGGSGFQGHGKTEASGGATNNSATNYPLVQLRRLDSEQVRWLRPEPTAPFSDTLFTSTAVTGFPAGPALVTVFVNAIPSTSRVIRVERADTTTTITAHNPDPSAVGQAVTINYTVTVSPPGSGTPTGNVTVTDGDGNSCVGTVAAGSCTLTPTAVGPKTLTASYAGDANFNSSSGTVSHQVEPIYLYLPLVLNNHVVAPNLVVKDLVAASDGITVVIENRGNAAVTDDFWVDVYVAPDTVPTAVNQTWEMVGTQGLAWGVEADLAAGEVLTLTVGGDYYAEEYSDVSWPLAVGTPVYAQVDSADAETDYGAVLEDHEISGGAYDNVAGPFASAAAADGAEVPVGGVSWPTWQADLPRRK